MNAAASSHSQKLLCCKSVERRSVKVCATIDLPLNAIPSLTAVGALVHHGQGRDTDQQLWRVVVSRDSSSKLQPTVAHHSATLVTNHGMWRQGSACQVHSTGCRPCSGADDASQRTCSLEVS